ncbi:MAG TPA: hypothetical protein DF282_22425 [Hyphomonas sp.]|jgi:hypothetical protein|nr:hypothetical protein [Hyphomonas sp.]|tara:strand:- start:244 stop:906 length:663 start_codon:yes stop_codon:yes gene_type:complete
MSKFQEFLISNYPAERLKEYGYTYEVDTEDAQIRHLFGRALIALEQYPVRQSEEERNRQEKYHIKKALDQLTRLEASIQNIESIGGHIFLDDIMKLYDRRAKITTNNPLSLMRDEREFLETSASLFRTSLQKKLERAKLPRGRPGNVGLEKCIDYLWHVWEGSLGRPFTLDYHQGAAMTPAFDFVKDFLMPVSDFTDAEIMTAMRTVIAKTSTHRKPEQN